MYDEFLKTLETAEDFYAYSPDGQYDLFVSRLCRAILEIAKKADVESEPVIVTIARKVM